LTGANMTLRHAAGLWCVGGATGACLHMRVCVCVLVCMAEEGEWPECGGKVAGSWFLGTSEAWFNLEWRVCVCLCGGPCV